MTPPSAIFAATVNGDLFALKRLMATADATSVNAVTVINKGVYTPLSRAAELGRQDVVRQLLSHPRINVARPPGMPPATPTALHRAAASGHESIVSLLLAHPGININAVAERDRVTAIELALSNSHWAIVHMLWPVVNDDSRYKCFDNALGMRRYEHAAALLGLPSSWQCDLTFRGRLVVEYLAPYLSVECLVALLIRDLPVGVHPTAPSQLVDVPDHSFSWMEFLAPDMTLPDDVAKPTVVRAILDHPTFKQVPRSDLVRRLMTARDRHDRPAINAADTDIRDYMTGELYFLGRYELLDGPPVHVSATAVVVLAYDHGICSQVFDEFADDEGLLDLNGFVECNMTLGRLQTGPRSTHQPGTQACERWESEFEIWDVDSDDVLTKDEYQRYCDQTFGNKLRVALKFMKHESDWAREVWTRRGLDSKYVLGLLPSHVPADCADHIAQLQLSSMSNVTMALFRHMIVLPAADRSLEDVFLKERPSIDVVIAVVKEVATALHHLHADHGLVHGDFKKLNVVRVDDCFKLIDLDAATHVNDPIGAKFSSGIAPPEMFYRLPDAAAHASFEQHFNDNAGLWAKVKPKGHFVVRSYRQDADASKLPYELVAATPAIDMWALGCMLFQMVSGEELVPTDVNQDVTADSIHIAATWSDAKLCRRIESQVANQHAQDLLKHLLVVDPASRVSAAAVLDHPFLTGEPGHASTAVVHAFQDIQASHRDVEARLNLLLESAQTTDHLIQTARTQLTTLKQSVVRGVFDASEATVPTSFVVFPVRLTSAASPSSSHIEAAIAQHLRALLASVKSIAQATLRGDALAQVMTSLTNGQPLYLYLVDEVQGSIVLHDPNHIYPVEIHPQDTSFLAAVVPLLLDGLEAIARAQQATGQSNAAWFDAYDDIDALGPFDDMMATLRQGMCLRGAALRRLKLWLFEKDPTASFAGLERVLVADGRVRWTSHAQAQQLRGSAPFHAHDGKGSVGRMALLDMMLDVTTPDV